MKRVTILGGLLILVLALAACAPPPTEAPTPTVSAPINTETPELPTVEPTTEAGTETATSELPVVSPTADTAAGAGVTIDTSTNAGVSEPFLVDQTGRSLYLFTSDTQNSGMSTCSGDCLVQWPPVIVSGVPQAGTGIDAALLGTITRDDGMMQATYNGWPLYYYVDDLAAGDMIGQGMGGVWYLVSGSGNAIQQ
jgi:predicted lipoprotein with Yx(FWY)xxD motif